MSMQVTITNVFDNDALTEPVKFKKGHGNAFLIETAGKKLLFDTGDNGKKLLGNLELLGVAASDIDHVILSHGHYDHVTGLVSLVDARPSGSVLPITAHPAVMERKGSGHPATGNVAIIGFPPTSASFKEKTWFSFHASMIELLPGIHVLGEIAHRPEQDGTRNMLHEVDGQWVPDPLLDDTSMIFTSTRGMVVLAGCCHAGLLNTLLKVKEVFPGRHVTSVLGGTHMLHFTTAEIHHVADVLEQEHGCPELYLNHCTGTTAVEVLRQRFGTKVSQFPAGASISIAVP